MLLPYLWLTGLCGLQRLAYLIDEQKELSKTRLGLILDSPVNLKPCNVKRPASDMGLYLDLGLLTWRHLIFDPKSKDQNTLFKRCAPINWFHSTRLNKKRSFSTSLHCEHMWAWAASTATQNKLEWDFVFLSNLNSSLQICSKNYSIWVQKLHKWIVIRKIWVKNPSPRWNHFQLEQKTNRWYLLAMMSIINILHIFVQLLKGLERTWNQRFLTRFDATGCLKSKQLQKHLP